MCPPPNRHHPPATCSYNNEAGENGKIVPEKSSYSNGDQVVIECDSGSTSPHTCQGGSFSPTIVECDPDAKTCPAPDSDTATISPMESTFEEGDIITATCLSNSSISGNFECTGGRFENTDGKTVHEFCTGASVCAGLNLALLLAVAIAHLLNVQ